MTDHEHYADQLATNARAAALRLMREPTRRRDDAIRFAADAIDASVDAILAANAKDLDGAPDLPAATVGRLELDAAKVAKIADALRQIASQPDPVGRTLHGETRPSGVRLEKRTVPLGVVLFIYESRPNVTADAAALCLKSANAVILRGGKEAAHSATALYDCIRAGVAKAGLPEHAVQLVDRPDRELVPALLARGDAIDVAIPRGGKGLIEAVTKAATMPVLKHLDGNCHLYVHSDIGDSDWPAVVDLIVNAKTSYPGGGVCNAVEHVLIHVESIHIVHPLCDGLEAAGVEIRGDELIQAMRIGVGNVTPVTENDPDTEYLSLTLSIKLVESIWQAIDHINTHGSRHTDGIITRNIGAAENFVNGVDSASVTVNASTRFADGGEYGLGAEIGISTDKLHARGPMGAADLCSYKWIVTGDMAIRR